MCALNIFSASSQWFLHLWSNDNVQEWKQNFNYNSNWFIYLLLHVVVDDYNNDYQDALHKPTLHNPMMIMIPDDNRQ